MPAPVLRDVRRRIADARIRGKRLILEEIILDAIAALPTMPGVLAAELDQRRDQLNVGKRLGDDQYVPAEKLSARLNESARRRIEEAVAALNFDLGLRVDRQDLMALALVTWLDAHQ